MGIDKRIDEIPSIKRDIKSFIKDLGINKYVYIAAATLDTYITAYDAHNNGIGIEGNPLVSMLMDYAGINGGLAIKSAAELTLALPLAYNSKRWLNIKPSTFLYILSAAHLIGAVSHIPNIFCKYS